MEESAEYGRRRGGREFVGRDVIDNCVEVVARITDTAERLVERAMDCDPRFGARDSAEVVRDAPAMASRFAYAINDGLRDVNSTLTDMMDLRRWDRSRSAARTTSYMRANETERPSEEEIVAESRSYIGRGRYRGATLDGLTRHLRAAGGYNDTELEGIIGRYFLIDGDIVLPAERGSDATDLPDSVEEHLRALGYADIRTRVRLERLPDAPVADLVAYVGDKPAILVMRVAAGKLTAPQTIEDARFQAKALDVRGEPSFLYLTDGRVNRYYSVSEDRIVTELPRQPAEA